MLATGGCGFRRCRARQLGKWIDVVQLTRFDLEAMILTAYARAIEHFTGIAAKIFDPHQ